MTRVLRPTAPPMLAETRPTAARRQTRATAHRGRWRRSALCLVLQVALWALPEPARAWELFRSENAEARKANELLRQGKPEEAEKLLAEAAQALPNHPAVHFNRGLALLQSKKHAEAREAFRLATQGQADAQLRANAHYNMGLAYMREADAAAQGQEPDLAQNYLREAVDAFKHSLRNMPGNRDAAWNLETAKRRLVELERQKQEREEREKQEQENAQDGENAQDAEDSQDGESEQKDGARQGEDDASQPGEREQDSEGSGRNESAPQGADEASKDKANDAQPDQGNKAGQGEQNQPEPKAPKPESKPQQEQGQAQEDTREQPEPDAAPQGARAEPALPEHMQKALDALSESDENLQKHRARMRSQQRPRRIEKDW